MLARRTHAAGVLIALAWAAHVRSEPALWPQPQSVELFGTLTVDPKNFTFVAQQQNDFLTRAFSRYQSLTFLRVGPSWWPPQPAPTAALSRLLVAVASLSLELTLNTSEAYALTLPESGGDGTLSADTVYGVLRGLETLSQLVGYVDGAFVVNAAKVVDSPRFPWRGALVDTARHWIPLPALYAFIDALTYNKMNVFHWHVVDDSSFAYVSKAFPNLSAAGAYNAPATTHTYAQADVAALISYARDRGIRVVVEFDTPGHSQSWGLGQVRTSLLGMYDSEHSDPTHRHPPLHASHNVIPHCGRRGSSLFATMRRGRMGHMGRSTPRSTLRGPSSRPFSRRSPASFQTPIRMLVETKSSTIAGRQIRE